MLVLEVPECYGTTKPQLKRDSDTQTSQHPNPKVQREGPHPHCFCSLSGRGMLGGKTYRQHLSPSSTSLPWHKLSATGPRNKQQSNNLSASRGVTKEAPATSRSPVQCHQPLHAQADPSPTSLPATGRSSLCARLKATSQGRALRLLTRSNLSADHTQQQRELPRPPAQLLPCTLRAPVPLSLPSRLLCYRHQRQRVFLACESKTRQGKKICSCNGLSLQQNFTPVFCNRLHGNSF